MFCEGCRYNLRGLDAGRCPECGRAFDPADPATFRITRSRFDGLLAPDVRARATIAILVLLIWSMTALFMPSIFSGPFMLVHVWDWWPLNAWTVAAGLGVLTPIVLWIITDRTIFVGLAIIAGLLSIPVSFWVVLQILVAAD